MKRSYGKQRSGLILTPQVELDVVLDSRRGLSEGTIRYYNEKLVPFISYLKDNLGIGTVEEITYHTIQDFMAHLEERGNNPGGLRSYFSAVRAMLSWMEQINDYEYRSPMGKVKAPKVSTEPLPGIEPEEILKLIRVCRGENARRDRAILYVLFDTGARVCKFLALNVEDVSANGEVTIRHGKGDKRRTVFLGVLARKALREYLRTRGDLHPHDPLFVNEDGLRFLYSGIRQILRRRAADAGMEPHPTRTTFGERLL